jgi:hypothetical protein
VNLGFGNKRRECVQEMERHRIRERKSERDVYSKIVERLKGERENNSIILAERESEKWLVAGE